MRNHLLAFEQHWQEGWWNAGQITRTLNFEPFHHVLVLGMGGSAIGGGSDP